MKSRTNQSRTKARILCIALIASLAMSFTVMLSTTGARADEGANTLDVFGYVTEGGVPVVGAAVTITETVSHATRVTTTDSSGLYSTFTPGVGGFAGNEWTRGDLITVDVNNAGKPASNSGNAPTPPTTTMRIDVTYTAIPEFGSLTGALVAAAAVAVLAAIFVGTKRFHNP